jgi:hypothetical protein
MMEPPGVGGYAPEGIRIKRKIKIKKRRVEAHRSPTCGVKHA